MPAETLQIITERLHGVAGGGRGIGAAVALALAKQGASLALVARTESQLKDVRLPPASPQNSLRTSNTTAPECVANIPLDTWSPCNQLMPTLCGSLTLW